MREPKTELVPVREIVVREDRVTPLNGAAVDVILKSVEETGEIRDPIHLRKVGKGGKFELIDGRHRLEVACQLDHEVIPARIWSCTLQEARLMEADANVTFTHMSPIDLAVSLAHRQAAYERLHPETSRGAAGAAARWNDMQRTNLSFADFIAELLKVSPRNVRRTIAAGRSLSSEDVKSLRSAQVQIARSDIEKLAKIDDEVERRFVIRAIGEGKAKKVAAARQLFSRESGLSAPVKDPAETALHQLKEKFRRLPKPAKRRFVEAFREELAGLLAEGGDA